jgi:hypothetical protein
VVTEHALGNPAQGPARLELPATRREHQRVAGTVEKLSEANMTSRRSGSFGEWVHARWTASDKELAGELHSGLQAVGVELSFNTVKSKLSKLLSGDAEGAQLIATPGHLVALAAVLRVEVPELEAAIASAREHPTLLLDPRLSQGVRDYFRARADQPDAAFSVEEIASSANAAADLKARAGEIPGRPIVVLSSKADVPLFEFAGFLVTLTTSGKRGHLLAGPYTDLVPEPPPAAPATRDAAGRPVYPFAPDDPIIQSWLAPARTQSDHDAARQTARWSQELRRVAEAAVRRDEWVAVPLADAYPVIAARKKLTGYFTDYSGPGPIALLSSGPPHAAAARWLAGVEEPPEHDSWGKVVERPRPARVWFAKNDVLMGFGPRIEELAGVFAPYHPDAGVRILAKPPGLDEQLARRNPFRAKESDWWKTLREEFLAETAVDLDPYLDLHVGRIMREPMEGVVRMLGAADDDVRARIRAIALRPFHGGVSYTLPLRLEALASSSLVSLPRSRHDALRVVGDLGAGQLMEIRIQTFEEEPAAEEIRLEAAAAGVAAAIDGGDFRAWVGYGHDVVLEGTARPGRSRREKEAEAAKRAAEDDDDDD